MGRPELPIDPSAGPVATFAFELRALRERSGGPSYRVLSRRTHYSVTTLSQAAAGKVLPTLPVLSAFVAACGGDVADWEQRWRALAAELNVAVPPADHVGGASGGRQQPPGEAGRRPGSWPRGSRRSIGWTAGLAVISLTAAGISLATASSGNARSRDPGPPSGTPASVAPSPSHVYGGADPIADGSDPNRAGCGPDAVTLLSTKVFFLGKHAGLLELRYSPHCQASWVRFTPVPGWSPAHGVVVTVWTIRPADDATTVYSVPVAGDGAIIGNILLTAPGCVLAQVQLKRGSMASPLATTACQVVRPAASSPPPATPAS